MTLLARSSPDLASALSHAVPAVPPRETAECWPPIDVIVAYRNEAALMADKVRNLRGLEYPGGNLRFLMVDGGSSDRSESVGRAAARGDPRFRWLSCEAGKTRQLNLALARSVAPWLLMTDADARLRRRTARIMMRHAQTDPRIALVATACQPQHAFGMDRVHWNVWNAIRRIEHRFGCVTALGPCYLICRTALDGWPEDVVADDVYVSLETNRRGFRSELAPVLVLERRAPSGARSFLWHKARKVRAVLSEIIRFLPQRSEFGAVARAVFLAKTLAILAGPAAVIAFSLWLVVLAPATGAFLAAMIATAFVVPPRPVVLRAAAGPLRAAGLVWTLSLVLAVVIVTAPFARQRAVFCRWRTEES